MKENQCDGLQETEWRGAETRGRESVEVTQAAENRWDGSKDASTQMMSEILHRIKGWDEGTVKVSRLTKHVDKKRINRP